LLDRINIISQLSGRKSPSDMLSEPLPYSQCSRWSSLGTARENWAHLGQEYLSLATIDSDDRRLCAGIYAFVSRSFFTCYNKIHSTDGIKKEDKFRAMARAVADELPDLLEICEASYTHVVQPVLKPLLPSNNMQDLSRDPQVPGVQMATDGDLHSLRKTSIPELLGVSIPPRGFVEELGSVTGGDADAETTLVRRQSTLHGHHEDGKDSNGDDDDDDDGSGEEEGESYD
jgi:hypothetical protein